jgi:hypothetical protein
MTPRTSGTVGENRRVAVRAQCVASVALAPPKKVGSISPGPRGTLMMYIHISHPGTLSQNPDRRSQCRLRTIRPSSSAMGRGAYRPRRLPRLRTQYSQSLAGLTTGVASGDSRYIGCLGVRSQSVGKYGKSQRKSTLMPTTNGNAFLVPGQLPASGKVTEGRAETNAAATKRDCLFSTQSIRKGAPRKLDWIGRSSSRSSSAPNWVLRFHAQVSDALRFVAGDAPLPQSARLEGRSSFARDQTDYSRSPTAAGQFPH